MAAKGRAGRVDEKNDLIPKENHGYHTKYSIMQSPKHMIMYFQNKPVFMKDCRF